MEVTLVESIDDLGAFFRWLGERRSVLAIDVETDGLRWWDGQLRLVQFGDCESGWSIPWEWYPKAIKDALHTYEGRLAGWNFPFDLHWLERFANFNPPWERCTDGMVAAALLEPHLRSGLKEVATRHVHPNAANGARVLKQVFANNGWEWGTVPIDHPAYWGYAAMDTILTARCVEKLGPLIQARSKYLYDIETRFMAIKYNMEKRGVQIDIPYTMATLDRFTNRYNQFQAWSDVTYKLGLGSNPKCIAELTRLGYEFTKTTKTGQLALDEMVLLEVMRDGGDEAKELASNIHMFRKLRKMSGTYLNKFLELADSDGILHASIKQLGARTGRMSVATPSLQNLPRNAEVRNCFVPREGHSLVLSDFDQIEVRLLEHFSQDPALRAAIMDGDVHTTTAQLVYQDASIDKRDYRRQISKSAVFAKMYGAGVRKFALTAGISEAMAEQFMTMYDTMFPQVPNFIGHVIATARDRCKNEGEGYVTTPIGRRQTIGRNSEDAYKLVNYLLQGTAADIMKTQAVALDAAGLGEFMVLPVHDEIILDVPDADVEDVCVTVQREMPIMTTQYTVPITSDLTVTDRWGKKYEGQSSWIDLAFEDVFAEEIADV